MKTYLAQRLGIAVLTLFGMSIVIFVLMRLAPGDIVDILFGAAGYVNEADKKLITKELGIDRPLLVQYGAWLRDIFTGDLGKSYRYDLPAWQVIKPLIPVEWNPETYLRFALPGLGIVVAVVGIVGIGALTANLMGRSMLGFGERMLTRVPLVRSIYSAL